MQYAVAAWVLPRDPRCVVIYKAFGQLPEHLDDSVADGLRPRQSVLNRIERPVCHHASHDAIASQILASLADEEAWKSVLPRNAT